ncbi:MAG: RNA methyltransferase [Bacteroidota bacterium]|jgi:TrmH family RNA methyltransferase
MSRQKLAVVKKLLQKKYREEEGKFIIEGWKSIEEAVNASVPIDTVIYDEQRSGDKKLISRIKKNGAELLGVAAKDVDSLSDAVSSQGVIAVLPKLPSLHLLANFLHRESALIVAVEQINDPGNLGTIIRTCDWFGVDAVVIGEKSVELYNPKVVRATMGSLFHLPVIDNADLVSFFKKSRHEGFSIYSTELNESSDFRTIKWEKKSILVIGNESHGVSNDVSALADHRVKIPALGKAESLNAAMACGIILARMKL